MVESSSLSSNPRNPTSSPRASSSLSGSRFSGDVLIFTDMFGTKSWTIFRTDTSVLFIDNESWVWFPVSLFVSKGVLNRPISEQKNVY